jgi:hypothetical protein
MIAFMYIFRRFLPVSICFIFKGRIRYSLQLNDMLMLIFGGLAQAGVLIIRLRG